MADDGSRDPAGNPNAPAVANAARRRSAQEARTLAATMFEAKDMSLHVIDRLEAIMDQVEASQLPSAASVGVRLEKIAKDYVDFLARFHGKKTVFRLAHNRAVVTQTLKFHDDIDNLRRGLGAEEEDTQWRERWERYRDAQQAAFERISRNRVKLIGDLRSDAQAQTEALGFLLFEYNRVSAKYTEKELTVLNRAFNEVSQFSKNKAPTISTWFLPPYYFDCDKTPFAWGGFGTVHRGKHAGCEVVVKRVKIATEADRAAFVKEANTWFRANQVPNVVRMFGAYHLGAEPYFVSEYVANGTLFDFLFDKENRHKTWKLLHDVANGLRALHQLQILHNDLKCNNILVSSDFVAKLMDFGLSAQLSALDAMSARKPEGAYAWKAPEVLLGTIPQSYASDVYSFAMCIYEAVTLAPPWTGVADVMIRRNVKKGVLPKRLDGVFSDEQWQLIVDMAALKAEDRLSMDEVVRRLHAFQEAEFNAYHFVQASAGGRASVTLGGITEVPEENEWEDAIDEDCSLKNAAASAEGEDLSSGCDVSPDAIKSSVTPVSVNFGGINSNESGSSNNDDSAEQIKTPSPLPLSTTQVVYLRSASIRGFAILASGRKGIEYRVELVLSNGASIQVQRRYSDLRSLYRALASRHRQELAALPRFPSRKLIWSRNLDAIANERLASLNSFVESVIRSPVMAIGVRLENNDILRKSGLEADFVM